MLILLLILFMLAVALIVSIVGDNKFWDLRTKWRVGTVIIVLGILVLMGITYVFPVILSW